MCPEPLRGPAHLLHSLFPSPWNDRGFVKQACNLRPRRRLVACAVLFIVAAETTAQPPVGEIESEPASSAHFAAGFDACDRHDYRRALAEFEAAIAAGSEAAAAHYNVAVCRYRLADYAGAADAFRALARRFPAMRDLADYNLGLALTRQDRLGQARTAFERAQASGDERIAALARAMLARLPAEAAPRASRGAGFLELALGDVRQRH